MSNSTLKMMRAAGRTSNAVMSQSDSIGKCCKHFFPFNEGSGDDINDVAGNVLITSAGKFTWDATLGSAQHTSLAAIALASGAWADINSKDFIMLLVGTTVDDGTFANFHSVEIGRTGSGQRGISTTEANGLLRGNDNAQVSSGTIDTQLVDGLSLSMAIIGDRSGNMTYRIAEGSTQSYTVSMTATTGFTPNAFYSSIGFKQQGLYLFVFEDGLPDDVNVGIDWMYEDCIGTKDGTKRRAYPPWVSLE